MMSTKLLIKTKSKNYPIFIGKNILKKIKNIFKSNNINFNKCFIVVDKKVPKKNLIILKKNIKCKKIFNEYKITLLKYNIKLPN